MNDFCQRPTTQKGSLGERIADRHLRAAGYAVYKPSELDSSHPVDRIAVCKRTLSVLLCDVKSKPRRVHYPDTGIDVGHWMIYWSLAKLHNMRVFLVFVDEDECAVYGQFLDLLDQRRIIHHKGKNIWYPKVENLGHSEIRYFPIASMKRIGGLSLSETEELQALSSRHKKYEDVKNGIQKTLL